MKVSYKKINFLLTEDQQKALPGLRKNMAKRGLVYVQPHVRSWPFPRYEIVDPVSETLKTYFSLYGTDKKKKRA